MRIRTPAPVTGLVLTVGLLAGATSASAAGGAAAVTRAPTTASAVVGSATPAGPSVQTVARFDRAANETPENIVRLGNHTVVSLAFASTVVVLDRSGAQVQRVVIATRGGFIAGIADDRIRRGIAVAVSSPDATVAGIWHIPRVRGVLGRPVRLSALPVTAFPNGLAFDSSGALYAADSRLGVIWRIPTGRTPDAQVYASSDLLAPAAGDALPGANGLKVFRGQLWVSNTSRSTLLTVPLGSRPSTGRVPVVQREGIRMDDFAIDTDGVVYAALNEGNALIRIATDGTVTTLADSSDGLHNTSAVALERNRRTLTVYLTNAAFDGPLPAPSVQRLVITDAKHPRSTTTGETS